MIHRLLLLLTTLVLSHQLFAGTLGDERRRRTPQSPPSRVAASAAPDVLPRQPHPDRQLRSDHPASFAAGTDDFHHFPSRQGIDVSHHQGPIDWQLVAREGGISYVYMKATEGATFVDKTYAYNREGAQQNGLKVGSYHYYRPTISIDQQFQNLTTVVLKSEQDLVPMIDIEEDKGVSEEKFIRDLTRFIAMVEAHYGQKPLLYSGEYFYNRHFQGLFQDYEWMMARYSPREPILKDGKTYLMWQYSDKGSIPGIRGPVDRSCIMGQGELKTVRMKK